VLAAVTPAEIDKALTPNVYVNVRPDGIVQIVCHRSEMGQGIRTCLPQIIADELDADWDKIRLEQALGDEKYGDQNTDGSTSIRQQFDLLRGAGAAAREMLVAAAAVAWGVPAAECVTHGHAVHHESSGRSMGYGELVPLTAGLPVPEKPAFKSKSAYRYIGKSIDTIDGFAMSTGAANYGIDAALPGMLHASIARCPTHGGTVKSVDDKAARAVRGVVDVIRMPDPTAPPVFNPLGGVAVLATDTWSAQQGREALKIEWDKGGNGVYDSEKYREDLLASARSEGKLVRNSGNVLAARDGAARTHVADFYAPHLAQAPMEPPAALARVGADGCDVWSCTQNPQATRDTVAAILGLDKSKVRAHVTLLGGGFGRKSKPDFGAEAAWLAQKSGKPVKVTWTREDDLRHGYFHSVSAQHLEATLDEEGNVTSWLHRTAFPSIGSTFDSAVSGPSAGELGLGFTDLPYAIPNLRLESCDAPAHVRIGWLRSVCNVYHAFAIGSFADELAKLTGTDSHAFLRKLIGPPRRVDPAADEAEYENYSHDLETHPIDTGRMVAVLDKAAEMADWGRTLPEGRGLGIAVHRSFLTTVATAAEVSRDAQGKLRVHTLWTAFDAGQVINPDRVRAQMEGAGIFGMSLAMYGEISAKDGAIVQGNFDTYPIVRMSEAPAAIHVHIMDVDAPPGGVGEPGVPPVAPALANAWFAATGERLRDLPFRKAGIV
jgi:isoquinoline 1-oxidoreductase beta subunit